MVQSIKHVGQKQRWLYNQVNDLTAGIGSQAITLYAHAHQSILKKYADEYQNTPSARAQVVTGAGVSYTLPNTVARYVLESIRVNHTIANQTNAPARLIIYDIACRRDTPNDCTYVSPAGNSFLWNGAPQQAWEAGLNAATETVIPPSPPQNGQYGVVPTSSAIFNKYFRIVKQTTVSLAVGAVHRHSWSRTFNRLLDASVYAQEELYGIQGITHFQMFVLVGAPATLQVADTDVGDSTGPAKVSIITDTQAVFTFGSAYSQTVYLQDAVGAIPVGADAATMTVGLPVTDTVKIVP